MLCHVGDKDLAWFNVFSLFVMSSCFNLLDLYGLLLSEGQYATQFYTKYIMWYCMAIFSEGLFVLWYSIPYGVLCHITNYKCAGVLGNRSTNLSGWCCLSEVMVSTTVGESVSQHTQNNYIRRLGTLRDRKRDEAGDRERRGCKQMNKWVKWRGGNLCFHCPPPTPSPFCWTVECVRAISALPPSPFASLQLHSFPNRNCSMALNM